jgi:magnesium transporter
MAIKTIKHHNLTWINIDTVDAEAIAYLKNNFHFHQLDMEDVNTENLTPKLDAYNNYLFAVLQFPHWRPETRTIVPYEIDVFVGEGYVITVEYTKSKEMKNFFYRCMKKKSIKNEWMNSTSGYLFYRIIEALYTSTQPMLNHIGKHLSQLEEEVFAGKQDPLIIKELGIYRRNILHFRRIIDPQRYIISAFSHTRRSFMDESLSLYFDNVNDYLNKIWAIMGTYKDTVEGLHVTIESIMNFRTNKIISILTAISASLLPLSLLSGIYGMNIVGLPFANNPFWVWMMFLGLLGIIMLVIVVMRKVKWL